MPLVTTFGDWANNGVAAPAGGSTPPPPNAPSGGWTGHACTPDNPCTDQPLPIAGTGPGRPTQAIWSLAAGQTAPTDGTGWKGPPIALAPAAPPPGPAPAPPSYVNGHPFGASVAQSPGSGITPQQAGAPLRIFGLPPLLVIGAGGLLVFLIARRL